MINDSLVKSVRKIHSPLFDFFVLFIAFASLFAIFLVLHDKLLGAFLSAWNFNTFSSDKVGIALFIYLILIILIRFFNRGKKLILIIFSLIISSLLYGNNFFILYVAAFIGYRLIFIKLGTIWKTILFFSIYEVFVYLTLNIIYSYNSIFWYAYIFANIFPLRFILYFYHVAGKAFAKEPFSDFLIYLFFPAYFIIFPHVVILPRYDYFTESSLSNDKFMRSAKSGIKLFSLGLLLLLLYWSIVNLLKMASLDISERFTIRLIPLKFILILLGVCGYGNILTGLIRGLGYDIKSPFRLPLFSRDIIDFFNRFLIYFKDFIIMFFFLPALILTKKLNRYLSVFVAVLIAMLTGISLYTFLTLGVEFCSTVNNSIRTMSEVSLAYAKEVPAVGILNLHILLLKNLPVLFILGIILGSQLAFNNMINYASDRFPFLVKVSANILFKSLQYIIMMAVVVYMYGG